MLQLTPQSRIFLVRSASRGGFAVRRTICHGETFCLSEAECLGAGLPYAGLQP
jgi:hypothetical protein